MPESEGANGCETGIVVQGVLCGVILLHVVLDVRGDVGDAALGHGGRRAFGDSGRGTGGDGRCSASRDGGCSALRECGCGTSRGHEGRVRTRARAERAERVRRELGASCGGA